MAVQLPPYLVQNTLFLLCYLDNYNCRYQSANNLMGTSMVVHIFGWEHQAKNNRSSYYLRAGLEKPETYLGGSNFEVMHRPNGIDKSILNAELLNDQSNF